MMGRSHVACSWIVGVAAAPLVGLHGFDEVVPFSAAVAGFALVPDLDCAGATASRLFGPVTGGISRVLAGFSAWLYSWTKGPRDEPVRGTHRHFSHTALFAVLLGLLAWWAVAAGGVWATAGILAVGVLLAVDALGRKGIGEVFVLVLFGAGLTVWATTGLAAGLTAAAGWVGWAVALGCLAHDVEDGCTVAGVPVLFPVLIRGETWAELRLLGPLSFHTGRGFETYVLGPVLILGGVLVTPGVWPQVVSILHAAAN